jgi:hypothetical protein
MRKFYTLIFTCFFISIGHSQTFGNEWINYNQKYYAINVVQSGIYKVDYNTLASSGVPLSTFSSSNIQISSTIVPTIQPYRLYHINIFRSTPRHGDTTKVHISTFTINDIIITININTLETSSFFKEEQTPSYFLVIHQYNSH